MRNLYVRETARAKQMRLLATWACADMPNEKKSCVVAAKTRADHDAWSQKGGGELVT